MTIDGQTRAKRRDGKKRTGSNSSGQPSILEGVSNAGYKPLSRTITIRAINLSFSPVTRIMRAARVSASITFEIPPWTFSFTPLILSYPRVLHFSFLVPSARVSLSRHKYIEIIQLVTDSPKFHDVFIYTLHFYTNLDY